jgi:predicted RNA-binding protein
MCESSAFVIKGDKKELIMENVVRVDLDGYIALYDVLGNSNVMKNLSLERIDLLKHEILFRHKKG